MSDPRKDLGYSPDIIPNLPILADLSAYEKGARLLADVRNKRDCKSEKECRTRVGKCENGCWRQL